MFKLLRVGVALAVAMTVDVGVAQAQVAQVRVNPEEVELAVGATRRVSASPRSSSGAVVSSASITWSSDDPSIVSVEVNSRISSVAELTANGPGTATITASVSGRTGTIAVTVAGAMPEGPEGTGEAAFIEVDPPQAQLLPTEELNLRIRFINSEGNPARREPITISAQPEGIVSVSGGEIIGIAPGRALLTISAADGNPTVRAAVEVADAPFAFPADTKSMSPGSQDTLRVVVPQQNNREIQPSNLNWVSSDPSVVRVLPSGAVIAQAEGTATVTATGFLGQRQTLTVRVHPEVVAIASRPNPENLLHLPLGGSRIIEVSTFDRLDNPVPEAVIEWSVGDQSVMTVEPNIECPTGSQAQSCARLTGVAFGTTTLVGESPGVGSLAESWDVEVIAGGLAVTPRSLGMAIGDNASFDAQFTDEQGTPLSPASGMTWTSSDPAVASVGATGEVIGVSYGGAQIVVSTPWGVEDTVSAYVSGEVLVASTRSGTSIDVFTFDRRTPGTFIPVLESAANEAAASYSPDGSQIIFVSTANGNQDIWIANADGSGAVALTETPHGENNPTFTPDGSQILFESTGDGFAQVWVMNRDGSGARALTAGSAANTEPKANADGSRIVFTSTRDGNYEVYTMAMDGTDPQNISNSPGREGSPRWLSDGGLAYLSDGQIILNRGGARQVVSPDGVPITHFDISADETMLAMVASELTGTTQVSRLLLQDLTQTGAPQEVTKAVPNELFRGVSFRR